MDIGISYSNMKINKIKTTLLLVFEISISIFIIKYCTNYIYSHICSFNEIAKKIELVWGDHSYKYSSKSESYSIIFIK